MTLFTARNYRILVWLLPIGLVVLSRDLLWSRVEAVYDNASAIQSLSARYRKTGVHIRELPDIKNDFEKLAHKKMEISSSLLGATSEAVSIYELLMLKAGETGVSVVTITPRPQRFDAGFAELPLVLEACGSYHGLARFTAAIENVNRIMRVEECAMSKDRSGRLTQTMKILVYRSADLPGDNDRGRGKKAAAAEFEKRGQYLADLNAALAVIVAPTSSRFAFSGQADPFGAVASGSGTPSAAKDLLSKKPAGLALKGIVWKELPLAIMEAVDGRTFIVHQGDTLNGYTVSSITRSDVSITSPQGTHVLHQYDQK
jgi:Tfp pilus assembly protein PilO